MDRPSYDFFFAESSTIEFLRAMSTSANDHNLAVRMSKEATTW
jgi:hypothetical protein